MTNSQTLLLISMTFISAKYNFVRYESFGLIEVSFIAIKGTNSKALTSGFLIQVWHSYFM